MSSGNAITLLVLGGALLAAWAWGSVYLVRRWRDDRFWLDYRSRVVREFGELKGVRVSRAAFSAITVVGTGFVLTGLAVLPAVVPFALGDPEPSVTRVTTVVAVAAFAVTMLAFGLSLVVWFTGRPGRLVPPALRERARSGVRGARR